MIIPVRAIIASIGITVIPVRASVAPVGITVIPVRESVASVGIMIIPVRASVASVGIMIIPVRATVASIGVIIIPVRATVACIEAIVGEYYQKQPFELSLIGLLPTKQTLSYNPYILNNTQNIILLSDFTKSGTQVEVNPVVVYPVGDVTPPGPAK